MRSLLKKVMERIIFVLSYEKKWDCWMIFANKAVDAGDFFQSIGRYSGEDPVNPAVFREVIPLIQKYDTPALYRQYGKKKYKDEREFLLKVEEGYIREVIRPAIESQVARVIDALSDSGFPLFLKSNRLDNFYKEQRIFLQPLPLRAMLRFERTGEYTRYILRLTDGERFFYPSDYQLKILSRRPCRVLSGQQLFRFPDDFDGQRLQPFLQKREVMIPKANEQLYFRKFILKNVRHEEIEVEGFEVIVREVGKKAILSLEQEVFAFPVLSLLFCYGSQQIPAWSNRKALVELHTDGDHYAFFKVNRDYEWERSQQQLLLKLGLVAHHSGCFRVDGVEVPLPLPAGKEECQDADASTIEQGWMKTVDWIRCHQKELQEFNIGFTQKALRKPYYTGNWELDFSVRETTDWFELNAIVVLADGRRIPLIRFRDHILSGEREYALEDGSIFLIPEEWFASYADIFLFGSIKGTALFLRRNQYPLVQSCGWGLTEDRRDSQADEITLPVGLKAVLRPYQKAGYEWLYSLLRNGLGGCLADDMGLGKTLQIISLLLKYRQETVKSGIIRKRPDPGQQLTLFDSASDGFVADENHSKPEFHTCLVIVPASLVHNWRKEMRKFAPQLTVTIYAGQHRNDLRPFLQRSDVVIVTYHTLRNDIDYFARLFFGIVVADEAQVMKNPDSLLHQAVLRVRGQWFFALSGTPVENSLTDLWAIMNLVNRDLLGSHHFFKVHFMKPILLDVEGQMSLVLQKLIAPYILRRTKEEVLPELPELTSELVICEPGEEQRKVYEEEQARVRNYILDRRDGQEGLRNDFMVLKALIRLRQIANHPKLVDADYPADSGKFREAIRMLGEVVGAGHKVLVFSSFVKYLNLVAEEISVQGWKYALLTGMTSDREQEIRRFTSDPECRIFLISLKAGGVGLNLTEAGYVFILDPWWNAAAEDQAVSRAHRMGQKQAVFVYRFITASTLEEKILTIQQRKQQLANAFVTSSATLPLSDEELLEALG